MSEERIDTFLTEQNVLSCLLKKPSLIYEVELNKDFFSNNPLRKQNKCLYMVLDYLSQNKDIEEVEFDTMTLLTLTKQFNEVKNAVKKIFDNQEDYARYIETLRDSPIDPSNVDLHVEKLVKINAVNDTLFKLTDYKDKLLSNYESWSLGNILNRTEATMLEVTNKYSAIHKKDIEENKKLSERIKEGKPVKNEFIGLPSPFPKLNKFTRGVLRKGSLTVINAKSGVGKSMVLKDFAKFLAIDNNIPVYWVANEQRVVEQENRLIQQMTGYPSVIIENRLYNLDQDEYEVDGKMYNLKQIKKDVVEASKKIEEAPLYIEQIPGYTPEMLLQKAKYHKKKHGIKIMIFDYIKQSSGTSYEEGNLRHFLDEVTRTLKEDISDSLGVPVLSSCQAKTYDEFLSAESYGIEKFSTSFLILRRLKEKEKTAFGGDYGLTVKKNRMGRIHPDPENNWIDLNFNEKYLQFEEV